MSSWATSTASLFSRLAWGIPLTALLFLVPVPASGFWWARGYQANLPMPTPAAWRAPLPAPAGESPPYGDGVCVGLETSCPREETPQALKALDELGLAWVRTEIPWAGVEPAPGKHDWQRWDRVVASIEAHGYQTLGLLCYWTPGVQPYSDASISAFGRYCETVARRYRGRVRVWEVWNEPNDKTFWTASPERYVDLLRAGYEGVKRGSPEALVLGASLSGADRHYLRRLLRAGAARWMDRLSLHPYSFGWSPESALLVQELRGMSAEMVSAGKSPWLWVTEFGNTRGEKQQAQWLERAFILMRQSGVVEAGCWYCLNVPSTPGFSLYRRDWSPKPAATTFAALSRRLRACTPLGSALPDDVTAPWGSGRPAALSPVQSWSFRTPGGEIRSSWVERGSAEAPALVGGAAKRRLSLSTQPTWDSPGATRP